MPIENSIEGTVNVTLDALAFDHDLLIQREVVLDVQHVPARPARHRARRRQARRVDPRRHRAVPRRSWHDTLPGVELRRRQLDGRGGPAGRRADAAGTAAIGPALGRRALRPRRCSPPTSRTTPRTRPASCSSPATASRRRPATTRRRSSCSSGPNAPGSLLAILQEFAARRINLTKLESPADQAGASATTASSSTSRATSPTRWWPTACATLHGKQADVKFLGSYPAAGDHGEAVRARRRRGLARGRRLDRVAALEDRLTCSRPGRCERRSSTPFLQPSRSRRSSRSHKAGGTRAGRSTALSVR